jgi:fucose 4-O-acetylase-like acetyltransferase
MSLKEAAHGRSSEPAVGVQAPHHLLHGIDLAKALVICLVVLGHVFEAGFFHDRETAVSRIVYEAIYSFHMPFYFLLSGWLFKKPRPVQEYFAAKSRHLLVPYVAWLVLFNIVAIAGLAWNVAQGTLSADKQSFYSDLFFRQVYGGRLVHGFEVILWFPTCLFLTQQIGNAAYAYLPRSGVWEMALIAYVLGYANQYLAPNLHMPWAANVVAGALPFFVIGHESRGSRVMNSRAIGLPWLLTLACIAAVGAPLSFHMRMAGYGVPIVSALAACSAFATILWLSSRSWLTPIHQFAGPLAAASMTIMYSHCWVIALCESCGVSTWWVVWPVAVAAGVVLHGMFSFVTPLKLMFEGG